MNNLGRFGIAIVTTAALALSGCATDTAPSRSSDAPSADGSVTLVAHDSFSLPDGVLAEFTKETGLAVKTVTLGDGGELATKLSLTPGNPPGDVAFGVDNTYAARPVRAGVFDEYVSPAAANGAQQYALAGMPQLTAVDYGDVCVNIDTRYFRDKGLPEPATLQDLADPRYKGLTVVEDPETASPGMAFLAGTVAALGDGWRDYWGGLRANDVSVAPNWTTAYSTDFSGSAGKGPKPIVVSYASSPAAEAGADGTPPPTRALLDTCFRQVEYAGVLRGTKNSDGARKLIDFLLSPKAQAAVPDAMFVYPVTRDVPLPEAWAKYAPVPAKPATTTPDRLADERDGWIRQWRQLMGR
ncbi:thiamine ABC transporter substrate binding subunit [Tsukamurella sp. 1534]|uniref:thiamine ABC transporter substrate-binding protein n=1 Tax=Tsukamurella sp. 1534 TaxID=1151061 RepID=UPI000309A16A|nr:thiamine ABC transporter substrate-binding protein [Tsukamurella sp. 1534]